MSAPKFRYIQPPPSTLSTLKQDLEKRGYAVLPNILTEDECRELRSQAFEAFRCLTKGVVDPEDSKTFDKWSSFFPSHSMLMQGFGVGSWEWLWQIRQKERVAEIFATIWDVQKEDLLSSFDAVSLHLPPEDTSKGKGWLKSPWPHTDQAPIHEGLVCVQGLVNLFDVNEGDATLALYPSSHKHHKQLFEKFPSKSPRDDWQKLTDEQIAWLEQDKGCEMVCLQGQAGSVFLWDSRTFHQGAEPSKSRKVKNTRLCAYVCYTPRKWASQRNLLRKQKLFKEGRTTSHWPHRPRAFGKKPRTYGNPLPPFQEVPPMDIEKLSALGKRLAGF